MADFNFSSANAIGLGEVLEQFGTNAINTVVIGIQPDNSKSTINNNNAGSDALVNRLLNNGVANDAEVLIDPCKSGKEKYYIQTPYVINDTPVGLDDDGQGCCVGTPSVQACRYKLGIDELCVKDCVDSTLDEMMESNVFQHSRDTKMPWSEVGKSIRAKRNRFFAKYSKFIFERNLILGTPEFSGDGMRPFNGLLSRLVDDRVFTLDGSAGFLSSLAALDCRLTAMGMGVGNYIIAINPIALPTLRQEVRTYLKSDPLTKWRLTPNGVAYDNMEIITSRYVDVDLETNTTSMWLIDPSKVGIKTIYTPTNPYLKRIDSAEDCGGHCIGAHLAGTTVVTNWTGLVLVTNVHLSSLCDSAALSGLDAFVNSGSIGQLYPKVTANPAP